MKVKITISEKLLGLLEHILYEFGEYYEHDDEIELKEEFFTAIENKEVVQ